jgi:hypothetical protein
MSIHAVARRYAVVGCRKGRDYSCTLKGTRNFTKNVIHYYTGCSKKELCKGILNVTVWRVLRKRLRLKAYKVFVIQRLELRIIEIQL